MTIKPLITILKEEEELEEFLSVLNEEIEGVEQHLDTLKDKRKAVVAELKELEGEE